MFVTQLCLLWASRDLAKYNTITLLIRSLGLVINKDKIKKIDISWLNPLRRDGHTYLARIQFFQYSSSIKDRKQHDARYLQEIDFYSV